MTGTQNKVLLAAIAAAVMQLDPTNDNHWTEDGLPRIDTVKFLSGDSTVTRASINEAVPGLTRANAKPPQAVQQPVGDTGAPVTLPALPVGDPGSAGGDNGVHQEPGADADGDMGEVERLQAAVQAAQAKLDEGLAAQAEVGRYVAQASAAYDRAVQALEEAAPSQDVGSAIQQYLSRQVEQRNERAKRVSQIRTADLKDIRDFLVPQRSALDNAMARKTARGGQRPNIPLINQKR